MTIKNTILAESKIQSLLLIEQIDLRLREKGYVITNITTNTVSFRDNNWQLSAKDKIFKKVDKGKFEVFESSGNCESRIKYTYYISFFTELIIAIAIIIISFYQSFLILLILLPFLIQFVSRVIALKTISTEFIAEIIN